MAAPWTPTATNVSYPLGVGTVAATERCNVFVPDGSAPASGWPVVLWIEETALDAGALQTSIAAGQNLGHQCLARGVAFVSATVTRAADGLFAAPGSARWNSGTYPSAWKSAVHLVQWARANAATYGWSASKIVLGGAGIGADLALWAGAGPDWPSVGGSAQFRSGVSHRADAVIALRPCAWFPAVAISVTGLGFAEAGDPSSAAGDMGDVEPTDLVAASPIDAVFDAYQDRPILTWAPGATGSTVFDAPGNVPTLEATLTSRTDAWGALILRRMLMGASYQYHLRRSAGLQSVRYVQPGAYPTEILGDDADVWDRAAQWALGAVGDAVPIDPVSDRIVRNLMAQLRTPERGATYFHTIHQVRRGPYVGLAVPARTCVWVTNLATDIAGRGQDATGSLLCTMRVEVEARVKSSSTDVASDVERLASDLETAIYADRTLGGLATETMITAREPAYVEAGMESTYGLVLSLDVQYQTPTTDTLTHS